MSKEKESYQQIMKATSLFGGVQVFNILISILRSKVVAVLLGPAGIGVVGLLQTTISFIGTLTNFGLGRVAVKDVAAAVGTSDLKSVAVVVTVLRRLVWATGFLGSFVTFSTASWLSKLTFGNEDYTEAFMWLSVTLLFNQLSSGQSVLLQGFRKLKLLAAAGVLGSFISLLITVPLYYHYGERGIVPVIVSISLSTFLLTWYFSKKVSVKKVAVSTATTIKAGKQMLVMGFAVSMSGVLTVASSYILRIYISNAGNVADVGMYSAGFAIIGTYVGLVFSAMTTDYYPRLAAISHDNEQAKKMVNQQAEMALLILSPILVVFIVFIKWVVIALYSNEFLPINGMIHWAALGIFFKAASWPIGVIFMAKGATKLFFWSELVSSCYLLLLNVLGYTYYGLDGLGISFLISYVLLLLQVFIIAKLKYDFVFSSNFLRLFGMQFILAVLSFIVVFVFSEWMAYSIGSLLIVISSRFSWKELDKRIKLQEIVVAKYSKLFKNKKNNT
jgi:O-antigen/teichoic acid export membrane protein